MHNLHLSNCKLCCMCYLLFHNYYTFTMYLKYVRVNTYVQRAAGRERRTNNE